MKRVEFLLESDVMVGGVRTTTNFLESADFISGAVLRAGFAWNILYECPYADEETDGKVNFVSYRNEEKCVSCPYENYCKNFGEMKFSCLYPKNAIPAPLTLYKCKSGGTDHCVMDTVAVSGRLLCTTCKGRMESVKGYVDKNTGKTVKILKNLTVHTAIDINTSTAKDGSLFSINAIKHGQIFYGYIDDCDTDMVKTGDIVRVGKYSSCGFGKLKVINTEPFSEEKTETAIQEFNDKFKQKLNEKLNQNDREYAALQFISDAVLTNGMGEGMEKVKNQVMTSEGYKKIWQEYLLGEKSVLQVENVYAQNFAYSGFDTSIKTNSDIQRRKDPVIMTKGGSSFLISFNTSDREKAVQELKAIKEKGIGKDTEIGYGQVEVCSRLHCLGITEAKND